MTILAGIYGFFWIRSGFCQSDHIKSRFCQSGPVLSIWSDAIQSGPILVLLTPIERHVKIGIILQNNCF